jgi:Na+/proline symporter
MNTLDWILFGSFFFLLIAIGVFSYRRVSSSNDFFVGGGKIPWWLMGVSHHVSGYSGAVFVAYAGIAYTHGFTIYVWWAFTITIAISVGAYLITPHWSHLRKKLHIQSPTEFLEARYNLTTQQLMAWSGMVIKLFDIAAKWAAIAIIMKVFTGLPLLHGILLAGSITLIYITIGGLWADVLNDFAQFVIQVIAGFTMLFVVISRLGGWEATLNAFGRLPEAHTQPFNTPYTFWFALTFLIINFLSYNGGQWNLAMRFLSSRSRRDARKTGLLSAALYLIWPLIIFFPMWLGPILLPELEDPSKSYALMAQKLLPQGLVGLVLAGMFANTMSMTASDSNTIASVITRDILPKISLKIRRFNREQRLWLARVTTFTFTLLTIIIAANAESFGGVLGLIVSWFAALLGPIAVPMILGFLPFFRNCSHYSAIIGIVGGIMSFIVIKTFFAGHLSQAFEIAMPVIVSFIIYVIIGFVKRLAPGTDRGERFFRSLQ